MMRVMARKNLSQEFRRQAAVDLYESTSGVTVRGVAEDLGIVRGTLRQWLADYGTGKKTAADGTLTSSPLRARSSSDRPVDPRHGVDGEGGGAGGRYAGAEDRPVGGSGP